MNLFPINYLLLTKMAPQLPLKKRAEWVFKFNNSGLSATKFGKEKNHPATSTLSRWIHNEHVKEEVIKLICTSADNMATETFGIDHLYQYQRSVIQCILNGHSAVSVQETGGGKSLCYQIPALLLEGVTIVFSPIIALMRDQISQLRARNVHQAAAVDAETNDSEMDSIFAKITSGELKLLYISPEKILLNARFLNFILQSERISFIVFDEAHLIYEWGSTFRMHYLILLWVVKQCLKPRKILFTTATMKMADRKSLMNMFIINEKYHFYDKEGAIKRKNIQVKVSVIAQSSARAEAFPSHAYQSWEDKNGGCGSHLDKIDNCINSFQSNDGGGAYSVIVYCKTRKLCEIVRDTLNGHYSNSDYDVYMYHAGMTPQEKEMSFNCFMNDQDDNGKTKVMAATTAFGLGN